jgi:hypothetical protein
MLADSATLADLIPANGLARIVGSLARANVENSSTFEAVIACQSRVLPELRCFPVYEHVSTMNMSQHTRKPILSPQ